MPNRPYDLQVVTPERVVLADPVVSLVAPGTEGKFGVLARHAPLVAELGIGDLAVTFPDGQREELAIAGGFLEVSAEGVIVLADTAERVQDIDPERAEQAKLRSERRLRGEAEEADIDTARARAALLKAVNRLKIAARSGP
jgi:F-type H+-transporting ATPase subunit epsilon